MKKITKIILFSLIFFSLSLMGYNLSFGAEPPVMNSTNYRAEILGLGSETTLSIKGDATAPVISNLQITTLESTYTLITWNTDENANSIIEFGPSNKYGTEVGQSEESTTNHSVKVSGLIPITTYHYRAKSKDDSDNIATSSDQTFTTTSTPAIFNVTITDISLNSAVISWSTSAKATSEIIYGKTLDYGQTYLDQDRVNTHTVRLTGLESGSAYHFRIRGTDSTNLEISSDDYSFETVILPTIAKVKVESILDHSVIIRWESSAKIDELIEYEAFSSTFSDSVVLLEKKTAGSVDLNTDHALKLLDLEPSTTYRFRIYGKDAFGNQAVSDLEEFTTEIDKNPPVITNLRTDTAVDLGNRDSVQVLVSWSTDEPASGYVEYGSGAGGAYSETSVKDEAYSNSKIIVVPKLIPGTSYHLRASATDKTGNTSYSDDLLILAPEQGMSLLELILGKLGNAFGWIDKL